MNSHPAQNAGKDKAASLALWRQTEMSPPEAAVCNPWEPLQRKTTDGKREVKHQAIVL